MQDTPQQPEEGDTGCNQARAWHLHGGPLESTTLQSDADYQSSGTTHEDFADYHYVVISKPGVPFFAASKEQSNPTYQKRTSLECRVSDVICVLDLL